MLLERIGDVFEKDQAQDDVLVLRCVHIGAEFVRSLPEFRFEPECCTIIRNFSTVQCLLCHRAPSSVNSIIRATTERFC